MDRNELSNVKTSACAIRMLSRKLTSFVSRILEPFEVTSSQADCLFMLSRGETSPSKIAETIGVDASNLSRMIRQFEEKGWLERHVDKANRRRVELILTEAGMDVARKIDPHAAIVEETMLRRMTAEEHETLMRALTKISDSLDEGPARAWPGRDKDSGSDA